MWYVYIGTHTHTQNGMLAIKNEILLFASNVDLENIMLSEIRQEKTNTVQYHLYVESKR